MTYTEAKYRRDPDTNAVIEILCKRDGRPISVAAGSREYDRLIALSDAGELTISEPS